MLNALLISQGLLWFIIIVLSIICLAMVRQIGVLYERIAPAGALSVNKQLKGGDKAPSLELITLDQQPLRIGANSKQSLNRSQLIFFLSPSCPICKTLLPVLRALQQSEAGWLDIILASDGDNKADHRAFIAAEQLQNFPYILSQPLGLAFAVSQLPYAVLIDEQDVVVSLGLTNSREHIESLFEAKWLGTATLQDYFQQHRQPQPAPEIALANKGLAHEIR